MYGLWLFKEIKTEYGYCKIEIYKKSYSGSPIEIEAVEANSLTLSIENLSETISPIGKSVCSFSIVDTGQLSYDDFFTPDATGIKVVISTINEDRGDVAYTTRWSGFVTPDFYSESLVYRTAINISARDNIGYLSDVEFDLVEPSIQVRELFSKAFGKISEQYPMDVMFRSHKTTEDGVLLTDAVISTALFKDKTWGEVLELILHDLGLQMRWIDNNIIAILDLSLLPEFFIPTDFNFVNSSGYREITPAYRQLSQKQDYGVIENFFNGQLNSDNLTFYKKINIATPLQTREEGYNSTLPTISYYTPNNWGVLMKETFTIQPTLYNLTFGDKIWFTGIEDARLFAYTHMSYEQSIHISNKPMTIKFSMLNTIQYPEYGTNKLTTYDPTVGLYIQTGDFLQLGLKCNCILHSEDNKTYILREKWVELSGLETTCIDFILPKVECTRSQGFINEGTAPVEKELTINIATIPANGILEFRIYGFYIVDKHNYWEDDFDLTKHEIDWTKCVTYIKGLTYTLDSEDISSSQTSVVTINDNHNIKRSEVYKFGEVPANEGAINAYAGGLFHPTTHLSLNGFKRNEDSPSYNLLELVGREIIHFNKKNYNKLSGEIKSPTKEPLKFNSLFSREGKLYYPFSCSLNVIDNTMTITSMQEIEPYTTESFTEIHSEVKSDGGTTVSGGNNTVLQYSEDAGNAKRLYEMQDATPAEKEKAFALVDSPDFPQARRIRVADLIGLDEQALAQYLELNKYLQENDLTPITNRIGAVEGYFTNGSAKDALKLGGIDAANYWHKGNSGTLDYDWKAKKLNVRTLVIPTSEPTDLSQGEVGFYLGTAGQGAEEPNGSGGLDLTELWAELSSEDYAKKIHISHIPTIQYSSIAGRPSALANPYPLTINKVVYDGSEPITLNIGEGGGVADAVAWGNVFNKPSTISGYGITDAYTKDSVDLKLSGYLPKSGGILSSANVPLIVNRENGGLSLISYRCDNVHVGNLGFDTSGNLLVRPNFQTNSTYYNVIHTGNIGSQRVSYASSAGNAGSLTFTEGSSNVTRPILVGIPESGKVYYSSAITINYALQELNAPKFVGALIGNASSATKLQTARTIWGQSFDGTGNVSGIMTGVSTIHFGSQPYGGYGIYQGNWFAEGWSDKDIVLHFNKVHYSGNILIGTTTDNGYKLQVNGTFKANGLIIPTSAPTDLKAGDHALYLGSVGEGAELPSGAGGLDVAELWAELAKADESKQINVSHIPVIGINRVSGLQTALNNKADASALSSYLPKSGGTISSSSVVPLTVNSTGDNTRIAFKQNGDTLGYFAFAKANTPLFIDNEGGRYTMFHSGNFNPADYLPKTGGTINGSLSIKDGIIVSERTTTRQALFYKNASSSADYGTYIRDISDSGDAILKLTYDNLTWKDNTVIHSGNIGSQSVNYATTAGSAKASDVYAWAKAATKPTYTASEVGALSISGGTLTNSLAVSAGTISSTRTSTRRAVFYKNASETVDAGTYIVDVSDSGDAVLKMTYNDLTWKNNTVIHSGNYADTTDNRYLQLSGGDITGATSITGRFKLLKGSILEFVKTDGNSVLLRGNPNSNELQFYNGTTWNDVLHIGNYSSYALPLTGGTLSSANVPLIVNRKGGGLSLISYHCDNVQVGNLGFDTSGNLLVRPNFQTNSTYYNVIHSGNIGSQSVASANRLVTSDGKYIMYVESTNNRLYIGDNINATTDTFILGKSIQMRYGSGGTRGFTLNSSGNVTIGASDLAGTSYKLYVNGTFNAGASTLASLAVSGDTTLGAYVNIGTTDYCHITLKRNSLNYFQATKASGYIGFVTNGKSALSANCDLLIQDTLVCAGKTEYTDLGSTTYRWKGINAKTLNLSSDAKISGEMDANALVIPTAPPTNPQAGKHYLYLA